MTKGLLRCPCELSVAPECKHPKMFYQGPKHPKILVVGSQPSFQDDRSGKLFSGYGGRVLRKLLVDNKVDLSLVGWTNVISCYSTIKPENHHYEPCIKELLKLFEKKAESLELIFLLGETPLRKVLGMTGLRNHRGSILELGKTLCIPTYSPVETRNSSNKHRFLELDIQRGICAVGATKTEIKWKMVSAKELELLIPEISKAKKLTFDTEASGLKHFEDQYFVVGIGFCWEGNKNTGVFLPLEHPNLRISMQEYQSRVEVAKRVLALPLPKEAYNGEYDLKALAVALDFDLYDIVNYCKDPLQAYHLVDCEYTPSLSNLVLERLHDIAGYDSEVDVYKHKYGNGYMLKIPLEVVAKYCVGDCIATFRLGEILEDELMEIGSFKLYDKIVVPSSKVYTSMSINGVKIDKKEANRLHAAYTEKLEELESEILALPVVKRWEEETNQTMSLTSSKNKMEMVYGFYGIPEETTKRKDPQTGKVTWTRSLDKDAVKAIVEKKGTPPYDGEVMGFIEGLHLFSNLNTAITRYTSKWKSWVWPDGLVHADFNNRGTKSGRLSVTDPPTQTMQTRIDEDLDSEIIEWLTKNATKKMIASKYPEGYLVDVDYSQLELRLMAIFSNDEIMVKTYRDGFNGGDIHMATARRKFPTFDEEPEKVQKSLRVKAKTINFKGAYSFDPVFLEVFPGLAEYVEKTQKIAKRQGWIQDVFGRRRVIDNLGLDVPDKSVYVMTEKEREKFFLLQSALRSAVNHTIQAPGHTLLEDSLIRIYKRLCGTGLGELVLETHDSITADVPCRENVEPVARIMKEEMEAVCEKFEWITVPLVAEAEFGKNWWEMEKLKI